MKRTVAALPLALLLIAGCGGDDDAGLVSAAPVVAEPVDDGNAASAPEETTDEPTDEELAIEFSQCMRSEGVDFPDPLVNADGSIDLAGNATPGSIDPSSPTFEAAVDVCGEIVAGASFLPGAGIDEAEQQDLLLAFAQCLRGLGHDVIDPDLADIQAGGPDALTRAFGENFDPTDPANADSVQVCQADVLGGGTDG